MININSQKKDKKRNISFCNIKFSFKKNLDQKIMHF